MGSIVVRRGTAACADLIPPLAMLMVISACSAGSAESKDESATTFPDTVEVDLQLLDSSSPSRVGAVEELFVGLRNEKDIEASLEDGRVSIAILLGVNQERWTLPFHIVWPQDSDSLRMKNWMAVLKHDPITAGLARGKAVERLRSLIATATSPGGALNGRIRLK